MAGRGAPRGVTRRLLFTVNWDRFFVSHRLVLAEAARAAGWDVHIAVPPGDFLPPITAAGFPVHHFPLSRSGTQPVAEAQSVAALRGLYRRLQPDVVHQVAQKSVVYGSLAVRLGTGRRPAVVNALAGMGYAFLARGAAAAVRRRLIVSAYRALLDAPGQQLILQNREDRDLFVSQGIIRPERVHLIRGSGVDLARFAPTPEPEGPPVVLLAARLLWHKGVREFVEAARRLRAQGTVARFVLVGAPDVGNRAAVPIEMVRAWVAEGVVEHWGHRDDMPTVMAQAHVVCLPSYREGLPKVLLEAMAAGRPIVASEEPGCREVVTPGTDGLLVPVADASALASAIEVLVRDAAVRTRMGAAGRAKAEKEFGVERVIAATLAAYERGWAERPSR